ncbi:hypothetical protein [Motilimonas pumila]|uniref:Uncharacterized protein n=1 Tax=Motilimonas pumila TaxID=2303987 RepID=A0A418Y977_9GAMM|nr:hypothetical protein [Motilimonas pumila]RJG36587.1 hypothetical protein D1Z90_20320 [Motilimonas pumila]
MLERIVFGVVLGVVLWFFLREEKVDSTYEKHPYILISLVLVTLGFIIASAAFGLFFAGLAIIELAVGFLITNKIFGRPSDISLEEYKAKKEEKKEKKRIQARNRAERKKVKKAERIKSSHQRVDWYIRISFFGFIGYLLYKGIEFHG